MNNVAARYIWGARALAKISQKRWPGMLTFRAALGILKGIALSREREIYYREIRVTERRVSSAKVAVVKGPFARGRMPRGIRFGERSFAFPLAIPWGKCRSWYSTILEYCYNDTWINIYKKYPTLSSGKGIFLSIERLINKRKCRKIGTLYTVDCVIPYAYSVLS